MKFNNKKNDCVTTTEGKEIWVSRSVAVTLIATIFLNGKENFVLISQRGEDVPDFKGYWCLPCGYLDHCETGAQAVKREAWEEVGIDISKWIDDYDQPWFVNTDPNENRQNVSLTYAFHSIENKLPNLLPNNIGEGKEVSDAKWVRLNDIDKYNFAFNHEKRIKEFFLSLNNR